MVSELLDRKPDDQARYESAKGALLSSTRNYYPTLRLRSRYIRSMERQGRSKDLSLVIQEELKQLSQESVVSAHTKLVQEKPITITIVGNRKEINLPAIKSMYPTQEVNIAELVE